MKMPYDTCDVELGEAKRQVAELRASGRYERVEYVNKRLDGGNQYARVYVWTKED